MVYLNVFLTDLVPDLHFQLRAKNFFKKFKCAFTSKLSEFTLSSIFASSDAVLSISVVHVTYVYIKVLHFTLKITG